MGGLDVRMSDVVCRHGRAEAVCDVDLETASGQRVALTGRKWFVSGAADADLVTVLVRTDGEAPDRDGLSLLLVPTAAPVSGWSASCPCSVRRGRRRSPSTA
ncbi:acyl-CoA dehydrogenase family protein [Streptomyces sp. GDS52]